MAAEDARLIIDDSYVKNVGAHRKAYAIQLHQWLSTYYLILEHIADTSIPSGAQHDAVAAFADQVKILAGANAGKRLVQIASALDANCTNFITEINSDDQFLY